MSDAMVTARMSKAKKEQATRALSKVGLNASQAINLMFDRLISEGNADFLLDTKRATSQKDWAEAFVFVESLSVSRSSRYHDMSSQEIRVDRLKKRGLM